MRTSILSRSVIAVASLAIGSAAFAAVPATAATSNGITREMVLAAAAGVRTDNTADTPSPATQAALNELASRVCGPIDSQANNAFGDSVQTPDGVDGLAVTALVSRAEGSAGTIGLDTCSFVVAAPIESSTTFTGEATVQTVSFTVGPIGGPSFPASSRAAYPLSGDVFASPAVRAEDAITFSGFQAEGLVKSPGTARVLTTTKVADKKTKAEKKIAKKKYVKRIKAAKRTYAKALDKAGRSTTKRAAARMTYVSRRASAKSAYSYSIASYKLVKTRTLQAQSRRFSVEANNFFFS